MLKQWCCHEHFTIVSAHFFFSIEVLSSPLFYFFFFYGLSTVYIIAVPEMWKLDLLDKENHCQCYNFCLSFLSHTACSNFWSSFILLSATLGWFSILIVFVVPHISFHVYKNIILLGQLWCCTANCKVEGSNPSHGSAFLCGLNAKTHLACIQCLFLLSTWWSKIIWILRRSL